MIEGRMEVSCPMEVKEWSYEDRHSGIAPFPSQAMDTRNAIRYMKLHANEYSVDADKMFVAGDSSGGHTAFFSQLIKNDDGANLYPQTDADVKGIISFYGALRLCTRL